MKVPEVVVEAKVPEVVVVELNQAGQVRELIGTSWWSPYLRNSVLSASKRVYSLTSENSYHATLSIHHAYTTQPTSAPCTRMPSTYATMLSCSPSRPPPYHAHEPRLYAPYTRMPYTKAVRTMHTHAHTWAVRAMHKHALHLGGTHHAHTCLVSFNYGFVAEVQGLG